MAHNNTVTRLIADVADVADYRVSVDMTVEALEDDGWLGLVARYQDDDNHYRAYYFHANERFLIQAMVDGTPTTIGRSADLGTEYTKEDDTPWFPPIPELTTGEPHRLRLDVDGKTLRLWLDGRLIAAAIDDAFASGPAGLVSRRQAATFDDFEVRDFSLYGGL